MPRDYNSYFMQNQILHETKLVADFLGVFSFRHSHIAGAIYLRDPRAMRETSHCVFSWQINKSHLIIPLGRGYR